MDILQKDIDRFWSHVDTTGECWTWTGYKRNGYGRMMYQQKTSSAHRLSYQWFVGVLPDEMDVLHTCDNPSCVRPDHLFAGTHSDNMKDMGQKGRSWLQQYPERARRGDNHWTRTNPETAPHGERNGSAKLTSTDVRAIRKLYMAGRKKAHLAQQFSVSRAAIRRIVNGTGWKSVD